MKLKNKWQRNTDQDAFRVPRSVQQSIPIRRIHRDGVFEVGGGRFSKTWRFSDINYKVAELEQQMTLFKHYCGFLNSLPVEASAKITLFNRRLNPAAFSAALLMGMAGDDGDVYRAELNELVTDKAAASNNIIQDKFVTISISAKTLEDARFFFGRISVDLKAELARMGSILTDIGLDERLRLLHDFYRPGEEGMFRFDFRETMARGQDFKDCFAPTQLTFRKDHYELGESKVGRVLFLRDYGSYINDDMITGLMDYPRNMMLSIDIIPVGMDDAIKMVDKVIMAVNSDIDRYQQRQNRRNNFLALPPYQLNQMQKVATEYMDDLTERDQRLMFGLVTLTHIAEDREQLDQDTKSLQSRTRGCEFVTLTYQQEDGLNTVLPYGLRRIDTVRTLTSESAAALMPFQSQEIQHSGGIYYGVNPISHNLIVCNRNSDEMLNGNGFILGTSGSGKSMAAKLEIMIRALTSRDTIIIVDPEREYGPLVRALGGEVVTISAASGNYINAMDLTAEYGDSGNPVVDKSDFIMSLYEQIMGAEGVDARAKSIIDRCTAAVYKGYDFQSAPPTLVDLYDTLKAQPEPLAQDIALALELFTTGSLDMFAHQSNINVNNRILCFDILDLGESLKSIGLLVMLDAIWNRVIRNRAGRQFTHVYFDEIYLFFADKDARHNGSVRNHSGEFLYKAWKRFRKYYADITGVTQNVEELLLSERARMMLANSEFLMMFNQASNDRAVLAELLGASEAQMNHVKNVGKGRGLIRVGGALIPFENELKEETAYFKLMDTKPRKDS